MSTFRSGAGGKIVTNRRKERLAATPYDRPPTQPSRPPPAKSPNWFTGIVVPSARALASGAGKILSSIFSESESSSSEDEESGSEDDIDNDNHFESLDYGVNTLNETNVNSSEMMQHGQDSHLSVWRGETKRIIEQLIMHETFSREECDRLTKTLNSRVMDWSMEAGEKSSLVGLPEKTGDPEDADIYNKAVEEAKKWFQEKKVGSSSVTKLARGTCNLNSTGLDLVETGSGSPVDVARFYMKERPPWASPGRNIELRTPLTKTMKLFNEGTSHSVHRGASSSSKKRSSLASGSWNIQEELRRVRSKATEDMLRTPSSKVDPSLFAVEPVRLDSVGTSELVFDMRERMTEPEPYRNTKPINALVDAGVSFDPALAALESRQDGESREARQSKPATSISCNSEASEAVHGDGECAASKFLQPSSSNHAEEHQNGPDLSKTNGTSVTELTQTGEKQSANGLPASQASFSEEVAEKKKPVNVMNAEGNCELPNEAYMEVPVVTESVSLGVQYEELSQDTAQHSPKEKIEVVAGKQQGRKSGRYNRRGGRGRGK
ncbi:hypothetical protein ABFS82_01G042300 [Erythranthe guttata]|uniref:protein KAKU4 isoform X1 n=1 Tax=Erythranthe guttata TaxID=4155 RepID=UPI00064D8F05|nr:PREDICTED: protein KAKU4 isoform X1 [Erythranthe guttata]|eukprot:XP_012855982.1 PREDICTED: protein KAKU4 isoform X1 [Erythranthe guttata]